MDNVLLTSHYLNHEVLVTLNALMEENKLPPYVTLQKRGRITF